MYMCCHASYKMVQILYGTIYSILAFLRFVQQKLRNLHNIWCINLCCHLMNVYVCVFSFDVLSSDVCMCVAFVVTSYCVHCTRKYFCLQNWRFILVLAMLGMWCFPISDYQFSRTFVVKILYRNISIYGCFRGWHFITVRLAYTQIHFLFLVNQPKSDCIHHFLIPSEHANT